MRIQLMKGQAVFLTEQDLLPAPPFKEWEEFSLPADHIILYLVAPESSPPQATTPGQSFNIAQDTGKERNREELQTRQPDPLQRDQRNGPVFIASRIRPVGFTLFSEGTGAFSGVRAFE